MSNLYHPPTFGYSGLTIILSNPARDDARNKQLISGTAGVFFDNECLYPDTNRYKCDIRVVDDTRPLLPNTKCVLLLGQYAFSKFTQQPLTLDEARGNPICLPGKPTIITSFTPQDCIDPMNWEAKLNPEYKSIDEEDDTSVVSELIDNKGRSKTDRANYRFWLKNDTKKALKICELGGKVPFAPQPNYHLWPSAEEVITLLRQRKNEHFYFDMETDFVSYDMRCFAFSFTSTPDDVWVVPWLNTEYKRAYTKLPEIWRALFECVRDNITVAHNGAHFDFPVLALRYRVPIGRVYDTLVSQQRIYPRLEKSLGHCISMLTFEPYHKNEGGHGYNSQAQAEQLYKYCGKDVFTMKLIHAAQQEMMERDDGLRRSIELANASIKPYLTSSLLGIHFSEEERKSYVEKCDLMMNQQMRIMQVLTGPEVMPLISNKKCTEYFYNQLGYKIVGKRSEKTGAASLAKDNLLKLALANDNPVTRFLIKYRQQQKAGSILGFKVWRN